MDDSWLTLILLGLAAGIMPLVFGLEIVLLADEEGVKKSSSLIGGVNSFRLLIAFVIAFVAASVTTALSQGISNIRRFIGAVLSQFGRNVVSGQHVVLDALLIAAGILILRSAYRQLRGGSEVDTSSEDTNSKALEVGAAGALGLGLVMSAANINQWVLTAAGVNQILQMQIEPLGKLLAFILFLLLSSVMILLPVLIVLVRPVRARADLQTLNGWIHGALRYVVAALLFLIGLSLIWKGAVGLVQFLNL